MLYKLNSLINNLCFVIWDFTNTSGGKNGYQYWIRICNWWSQLIKPVYDICLPTYTITYPTLLYIYIGTTGPLTVCVSE